MQVHETPEPEHIALVKDRAGADLRPRCVAPGVWSLVSMHKPGIGGPMIPNRSMLYRVRDADGRPVLVVCNVLAPDRDADEPMGTIRRFAEAMGAEVRFILNPGPEHHLVLAEYARAFPDARVLVAAGRIQRENPALFALPNVEALPPGDAAPELAAMGLHVHVWGGLMEGAALSLAQLRFGAPRGTAEPVLLFHEESRTLLNGGHGWWFWGETAPVPWPVRKWIGMQQGAVVWSGRHYSVWDEAKCAQGAARVLSWDFDVLLDLHAPLDDWMKSGAKAAVDALCQPIVDGDWAALPLPREPLGIPEGRVTGGDWRSYKT